MPRHQLSRGRPKGSGLDDRSTLIALNRLLAADPKLKPTTAIRSMGISDPASVRRLREKLRSARGAEKEKPAPNAATAAKAERAASTTNKLIGASVGEKRTPSSPRAAFDKSWLVQWYDLGISAIASTVAVQMAVFGNLLAASPAALAFKHHVASNERVTASSRSLSDVHTTLH